MIVVSVCLPSDPLSQCLPSYLGFSYLGRGVSLHSCSSKVQPLLLTSDEGSSSWPCSQLPRSCAVAATREATNAGNRSAYFTAHPSLECIMRAVCGGHYCEDEIEVLHYSTDARPHKMYHNPQMAGLIEPKEAVSRCWSCPPNLHHRALCSGQRKRQSVPLLPLSSVCC